MQSLCLGYLNGTMCDVPKCGMMHNYMKLIPFDFGTNVHIVYSCFG